MYRYVGIYACMHIKKDGGSSIYVYGCIYDSLYILYILYIIYII
jgi:hypothetical protein